MATTERTDPYLDFRFHVEMDALTVGGFSSVSGLEHQMEPEEYEEGGNNRFTHKLPARFTQPNVELQRGITDSTDLWEWVSDAREGVVRRDTVWLHLMNTVGEQKLTWRFIRAYPVRWAGPEFSADQGSVVWLYRSETRSA